MRPEKDGGKKEQGKRGKGGEAQGNGGRVGPKMNRKWREADVKEAERTVEKGEQRKLSRRQVTWGLSRFGPGEASAPNTPNSAE